MRVLSMASGTSLWAVTPCPREWSHDVLVGRQLISMRWPWTGVYASQQWSQSLRLTHA